MANTLLQTAFLRPKIKSKKVDNLFFTGQLTVPGPGVPPSLISGKIASELIFKNTPQKSLGMMSLYNELTQACSKEVTLRYSTSFFRAVNLLSPSIQQDIHNIYGFVRFSDEIVDTFHEYNQKKLLSQFEKDFYESLKNGIGV